MGWATWEEGRCGGRGAAGHGGGSQAISSSKQNHTAAPDLQPATTTSGGDRIPKIPGYFAADLDAPSATPSAPAAPRARGWAEWCGKAPWRQLHRPLRRSHGAPSPHGWARVHGRRALQRAGWHPVGVLPSPPPSLVAASPLHLISFRVLPPHPGVAMMTPPKKGYEDAAGTGGSSAPSAHVPNHHAALKLHSRRARARVRVPRPPVWCRHSVVKRAPYLRSAPCSCC